MTNEGAAWEKNHTPIDGLAWLGLAWLIGLSLQSTIDYGYEIIKAMRDIFGSC